MPCGSGGSWELGGSEPAATPVVKQTVLVQPLEWDAREVVLQSLILFSTNTIWRNRMDTAALQVNVHQNHTNVKNWVVAKVMVWQQLSEIGSVGSTALFTHPRGDNFLCRQRFTLGGSLGEECRASRPPGWSYSIGGISKSQFGTRECGRGVNSQINPLCQLCRITLPTMNPALPPQHLLFEIYFSYPISKKSVIILWLVRQ